MYYINVMIIDISIYTSEKHNNIIKQNKIHNLTLFCRRLCLAGILKHISIYTSLYGNCNYY
jgi:hypothetical protein